jgi:hypothetical protein
METTRLFRFIDKLANESKQLAIDLSGSGNTIESHLLTRLTRNEEYWMELFDVADVSYFSNGWTSAPQASAQMAILRRNIVYFKEVYLSEINKAMRVLLSDTDTTSQVVRKPTLHLPTLIRAGKLSSSTSVVNAASTLEEAYGKWQSALPNLRSSPKDDDSQLANDGWSMYVNRIRVDFKLLRPNAKVLGAYRQSKLNAKGTLRFGNAGTLRGTGGGSDGGFVKNAAAAPADSHFDVGASTDTFTTGYFWTGTTVNTAPNVPIISKRTGVTFRMIVYLWAAGAATLNDNGGATPNVDTPSGTEIKLTDAAGTELSGTVATTTTATTTTVTFLWVASVDAHLVIDSNTQNFYSFDVSQVQGFGQIPLSLDGSSDAVPLADPTVLDCIGGRNSVEVLRSLNFTNFEPILAVVEVLGSVHGDSHIYNTLNLHYQTYLQTSADTASDLNTLIPMPLKSSDFWLGSNNATGITKATRQKLFKVYWDMVGDLLDMASTDGTVAEFFSGV